jgi:glycosyltransferase involved in cell wall biosynthesis
MCSYAHDVPVSSVDVVLPCLNEARALPWVLSRMPDGYRALVVDNGSTDDSVEVALSLGARVIHEPRKGFGAAAHSGLLSSTATFVAYCDADASMDPSELPRLVDLVASGATDLALGRRKPTRGTAWPLHARLANRALAALIRRATPYELHDLGPMRCARRLGLLSLNLMDRRSGYPLEMVLRAAAAGWNVCELDTSYVPRIGKSKVTGTVRGTFTAVTDMSRLLREARA